MTKRRIPELLLLPGGRKDDPGSDPRTVVICKPRRWGSAAVRSRMVHCDTCRAGCWLSVRGPDPGLVRILCTPCAVVELDALEATGVDPHVDVAPWYEADELDRVARGLRRAPVPDSWAGHAIRHRDGHDVEGEP